MHVDCFALLTVVLATGLMADEKVELEKDLNIKLPEKHLRVFYGSGETRFGETLLKSGVQVPPRVESSAEVRGNCTLILIDPDAPNRELHTKRSWLHWLVVDVAVESGEDLSTGGQTLADYMGAAPPPGSGKHRYVFVLYEQDAQVSANVSERGFFNISSFVVQNSIEPVEWFYYYVEGSTGRRLIPLLKLNSIVAVVVVAVSPLMLT